MNRFLSNKRGSQLVEFVVVIPVGVLVLIGAYYLNTRIDEKQSLEIHARNLASVHVKGTKPFLSTPMNNHLKKMKVFAKKQPEGKEAKVTVVSGSDNEDTLKRIEFDSEKNSKESGGENDLLSSMGVAGSFVGKASKYAGVGIHHYYEDLQNNLGMDIGSGEYHLVPKVEYNYSKVAFKRSTRLGLFSKINPQKLDLDIEELTQINAVQYTRKSSGYHPNEYKLPAFVGYGLGLVIKSFSDHEDNGWGSYKKVEDYTVTVDGDDRNSFSRDCLMAFGSNDSCSTINGNSISFAIHSVGHLVSLAKLISTIGTLGNSKVAATALKEAYEVMQEEALEVATESMTDYIKNLTVEYGTEKIEKKLKDAIKETGR